jgi:hypothetical protein
VRDGAALLVEETGRSPDGVPAIREIRSNPHEHGMGRAIFGILFGDLVTALFLFVLVASRH